MENPYVQIEDSQVDNQQNAGRLQNSANVSVDENASPKSLKNKNLNEYHEVNNESSDVNINQTRLDVGNEIGPDTELESDYSRAANLEEAKIFRNKNCVRKYENNQYSYYDLWSTSLEEIGEFSLGVELYFLLIKTMAFSFFLISGISVYSLYENSQGNGLNAGGIKQRWDILNVANVNQVISPADLAENKSMKFSLFIVDVICSGLLLLFIIGYQFKCNALINRHLANKINISDFAIKIKGIPEEIINPEDVRSHFLEHGNILEVSLAKRYNGILSAYSKRSELNSKLSYNKILNERGKNKEKTIEKLTKDIELLDQKIKENEKNSDKLHKELPTIRGYVIFDSIESRNKCVRSYRKKKCCFHTHNDSPSLNLSGKYPIKVFKAVPPSCIIFTNLEVSKCSKRFRRLLSLICIILVFITTMALVYSLSSYQKSLPQGPTCEKVDTTQSIEYAEKNYITSDESYCWCRGQSYTSLLGSEELSYCHDFFSKISVNITLRLLVSFSILLLNIVINFIVISLSKFEKLSNVNKERLKVMTRTFYGNFINTAIIILLVNANFAFIKTQSWLPSFLLNGEYTDFTREWYTEVGSTITSTMLIQIFSPHWISLFILYPIAACGRKCGIRFCVTQAEANKRFSGKQFDLAIKNSVVLKVIFCCFLYSAGMPILNVVCFLCLLGLYWIEKFLFFRHYAKPIHYNEILNNKVIKLLPFSVIIHCGFGLYMLGSDSIFPLKYNENNSIGDKIGNYVGFVYIIIMLAAGISYFWILGYGTCANLYRRVAHYDRGELGNIDSSNLREGLDTYDISKMSEFKDIINGLNVAAERVKRTKLVVSKNSI